MINTLGTFNLLTSHFVFGCKLPSQNVIEDVELLNNWIDFKDNDPFMDRYRTNRTQFLSVLKIIDLKKCEELFYDLMKVYKKEFPYSEKDDFIRDVFEYTLFDLDRIIKSDSYPYGSPTKTHEVYFVSETYEFKDYACDITKDIEYYKQYYKKVIKLINSLNYQIQEEPISLDNQSKSFPSEKSKIEPDGYIELLKPLSGCWKNEQILSSEDYNQLVNYVGQIINNNSLPSNLKSLKANRSTPNVFISKTLHKVYQSTFKKNKHLFVRLLKGFENFKNQEESTINSKFSFYQNNYEEDVNKYITYK